MANLPLLLQSLKCRWIHISRHVHAHGHLASMGLRLRLCLHDLATMHVCSLLLLLLLLLLCLLLLLHTHHLRLGWKAGSHGGVLEDHVGLWLKVRHGMCIRIHAWVHPRHHRAALSNMWTSLHRVHSRMHLSLHGMRRLWNHARLAWGHAWVLHTGRLKGHHGGCVCVRIALLGEDVCKRCCVRWRRPPALPNAG